MPVVEVVGLHKAYGTTVAVDDVSFAVEEGEVFGLLGPNGAGKTTTVETIEGLRRPDRGTVRVLGLDPVADHDRVAHLLGAQLQASRLPDKITVREALELFASLYPRPSAGRDWGPLAERLGLSSRLDVRFGTLSGGLQQRLSIALALIGDPRVVVLDELTTGLDPQARRETWSLVEDVRRSGVTVLLVTHSMEEAERLSDRVAVLDRGRVVALGRPDELVRATAGRQQLTFVPSRPVDPADLRRTVGVESVEVRDGRVAVRADDPGLTAVIGRLDRDGVVATQLRVEADTLDDAFLRIIEQESA